MLDIVDHIAAPAPLSNHGIKRESFARAVDRVLGYDFFVSYNHDDGMKLPRRIKERLEEAGFRVFLDQTGYVAGDDLRRETRRQVVKSRKIVVIARPLALKSEWVRREVKVALEHGKIPVIVDLNGAVKAAPENAALAKMALEGEWIRLTETLPDVDGEPTEHIISELVRGFNHTRQETWRQWIFATAALVFALLAAAATWQAFEATKARTAAEAQRDRAQGALNQIRGNEKRRVEQLSARVKREQQPAEAISQSPLQRANDLITQATGLRGGGDLRNARLRFEEAMQILQSGTSEDDKAPGWQQARVNVYMDLAGAAFDVDDPDAALATLKKGLDFLRKGAAADPLDLVWQQRLAVFRQETEPRLAEAETHFRESVRGTSTPSILPEARLEFELAAALRRLGDVEYDRGNAGSALAPYGECVSLLEQLPAAATGDSSRLVGLAKCYYRSGQALEQLQRKPEALEYYGKEVGLFKRAVVAYPAEPKWKRNAAAALEELGRLQQEMNWRDEKALHSLRDALDFRESVALMDPRWQRELEVAYRDLTEFLRPIVGREDEAKDTAEQYVLATSFTDDISQAESVGQALGTLSWHALLAGDSGRARWAAQYAVDLAPNLDWVKLNRAHTLMLSGERAEAEKIYLTTSALPAERAKRWKGTLCSDFDEMKKRKLSNRSDGLMAEVSAHFNCPDK
jgi:tetratricopeptide (TPR) repeat protein